MSTPPASAAPSGAAGPPASPTVPPNKPAILVVEDSDLQALILRSLLERHGFRVAVAGNGREALNYLERQRVDLVISDIKMPEFDGWELCQAIKVSPQLKATPVLLLTSLASTDDIIQGLQCQADYYLTKPYNPQFLLDQVQAILNHPPAAEETDAPALTVAVGGRRHEIKAGRQQMVNLLLSTYECAVQQNRELVKTQQELGERNRQLQAQTQRLQVSDRNFRGLLESSADGMLVVDSRGRIRFASPAAQRLLAKLEAELLGQPFDFPLAAGQTTEVQIARRHREVILAELRVTDTVWEGEAALLASLRDITERRLSEEKIREQQERLEQVNAQLQALATTDGLTGLRNHRSFKERLAEEFERARRFHQPLGLILLDVDHFKPYNDTFGHPAGDAVLRTVAELVQANTRHTDFAARYGGEEFAVLLPSTGPMEAIFVAERIRQAIELAPWELRPVTASLGVSFLMDAMVDGAELVAAADKALYASKQAGRNRMTPAGNEPAAASAA